MIAFIGRILKVAQGYRGRICAAAVCSFLKVLLSKAPIVVTFFLVMGFLEGTVTETSCLFAGLALVACIALQCVFQNVADRLQSAAGFEIFADMRLALGEHLRKMPMGFFTEGNIGRISSVLSTDMNFIEENLMMVLADLLSYLFSAAIFILFMFAFDWRLGLLCLFVSGLVFVLGETLKKGVLARSNERQEASQRLTEAVIDFTEGMGIIKTYNLLGEKSRELTDAFQASCDKSLAFENDFSPWARALYLICGLGSAAALGVMWALYQSGSLSLAFFIGMVLFVFEMFAPLKAVYGEMTRFTVMDACMDRIEAIFSEQELPDDGSGSIPAEGSPEIEFEGVGFSYGAEDVLHNVSFTVRRNTMTALVGPSGGGKSTIASLLARFWDVREGSVRLRGEDIREVPLAQVMDNISMVFQRVYLFQDTVYNNIAMGRMDATKEEVYEAAKKARCYDFIMALPQGFDTVVGEGGASLSGGEQQRISIARCMLKDTPIVVLDEATASVDADNESHIQAAISELVRDKTVLVIAHRLHTIARADQILVVRGGQIAERGDHASLMAQSGVYAEMVRKRASMRSFMDK